MFLHLLSWVMISLNKLAPEGVYYVNVDAEGGKKKKKKKKNFAKPKKKKHRHRKVKLATLKLYTVDNKGAV